MSLLPGEDEQVFNSIEDEALYWKNRSRALEARVRQLESKKQREGSSDDDDDDDDDDEEDPAKKMRMEEISKDYFKILPDHCAELIMSHLDGIDLYRMTKVSSDWKKVVKSDTRAAKKLIKTLTFDASGDVEKVCLKLLEANDVEYKYLTVETNLVGIKYMNRFSSKLTSLSIFLSVTNDTSHSLKSFISHTFPQLKDLVIIHRDNTFLEWFSYCKFPVLNSYIGSLNHLVEVNDANALKEALTAMPKLEYLVVCCKTISKDVIEALSTTPTLVGLNIETGHENEVELILSQMKDLKRLSISFYDDEEPQLSEMSSNTSITSISVNYKDNEAILLKMLKALPSLERLILHGELIPSTLDVIARYNLKMEKVTCGSISDDTLKKYEELMLKEEDNDQINTSIEIEQSVVSTDESNSE